MTAAHDFSNRWFIEPSPALAMALGVGQTMGGDEARLNRGMTR
jgi:hypothetical protein